MSNSDEEKALHVVLYSASQGCVHIETLGGCIESNITYLSAGKSPDYVIVGLAISLDDAISLSNLVDGIRHQWTGYERFTGGDMRPLAEIHADNEKEG